MPPELLASVGAAWAIAALALGALVGARRIDGLPLLLWGASTAWLVAPAASVEAAAGWLVALACAVGLLVRRPAGLARPARLGWTLLGAASLGGAAAAGLPVQALAGIGAVGVVGLVALLSDRRQAPWRTRWVGEIEVHEAPRPEPADPSGG